MPPKIEFFRKVCELDLEGIVAKRKNGPLSRGGTPWLKIRNPKYTQKEGRQELFEWRR